MRFAIFLIALALTGCAAPNRSTQIVDLASRVPSGIESVLNRIGPVVAPPPTGALYEPLQTREPYAGVSVTRDVAYGPDPRHRLDVFASAAGAKGRPVLIFVHGGAFTAGNKRTGSSPFYDNIMLWAAENRMVGINTTYRLAPKNTWPDAQEDLARVVAWARDNAAAHGGDPGRIYLMGHSAGAAHVAQYVAHKQFHQAPKGGIAGAIMVSGLFDLTTAEANAPLKSYFGSDASLYPMRSALPGLVASGLPMMFAYAALDPADFQQQARQVHAAMCAVNRCAPTYRLMGHSHMSEIYSINTADRASTDAMLEFMNGSR